MSGQFLAADREGAAVRIDGGTGALLAMPKLGGAYAAGATSDAYWVYLDGRVTRARASDGALLDPAPIQVLQQPSRQGPAHMAFAPSGGLALVGDERGGWYGVRLSKDAVPLDAAAFAVPLLLSTSISLVFDGVNFVAFWTESVSGYADTVRGLRVGLDGKALDPAPFYVGKGDGQPDVRVAAANGTALVVPPGVRVKAGVVLDSTRLSLPASIYVVGMETDDAAFNVFGVNATSDVIAARVSFTDGGLTPAFALGPRAGFPARGFASRRSDNGHDLLLSDPSGAPLYRLGADLSVKETADAQAPDCSLRGAAFDDVSLLTTCMTPDYRVRVRRHRRVDRALVDSTYAPSDAGTADAASAFDLPDNSTNESLDVVTLGHGRFAYVNTQGDPLRNTVRVHLRTIEYGVAGAACDVDGDCASTECVAGHCTDSLPTADAGDASTNVVDGALAPDSAPDAAVDTTDAGDAAPDLDAAPSADGGESDASQATDAAADVSPPFSDAAEPTDGGDDAGALLDAFTSVPPTTVADAAAGPSPEPAQIDGSTDESSSNSGGCSAAPAPGAAGPGSSAAIALAAVYASRRRRRHPASSGL